MKKIKDHFNFIPIVVLGVIFATSCVAEGSDNDTDEVPILHIGSTDFYLEGRVPMIIQKVEEKSDLINETDGMSICFWLMPYRFQETNEIFTIYAEEKDKVNTLKINLKNGKLQFLVTTHSYILDTAVYARQWSHICAVFQEDNMTLYHNGNKTQTDKIKMDPNIFLQKSLIMVGADGYIERPYIGKLGDIRIFYRNISTTEAADILKVKKEPSEFLTIDPPSDEYTSDYYGYSGDYGSSYYSGSGDYGSNYYSGSGDYSSGSGSEYDYFGSGSDYYNTYYSGYSSGYYGDYSGGSGYEYYGSDMDYNSEYDSGSIFEVVGLLVQETEIWFEYVPRSTLKISKEILNFFVFNERTTFFEAKAICHRFGGTVARVSVASKIETWAMKYNNSISSIWLSKLDAKTKKESCFMGLMTPTGKLKTVPAGCATSYFVMCMSRFQPTIRAYGIPETKTPLNFTLVYENSVLTIDSFKRFYFAFNDSNFVMHDFQAGKNKPLQRSYKKASEVMGRHTWSNKDDLNDVLISLTSCRHGQFTCDDGNCISLLNVCDLENNCPDGSDERTCEATIKIGKHYNPKYSETQGTKKSTNVTGYLILNQINKVNMEDGKVSIGITFFTYWTDKRLAFKFLPPGTNRDIPSEEYRNFWLPDVIVIGAEHNYKHKLSVHKNNGKFTVYTFEEGVAEISNTYEVLKTPGKYVTMSHNKTDDVSLLCKMELFYFPFDIQNCKVKIQLKGHLRDDANWNVYTAGDKSEDLSVSLFEVDNFTLSLDQDDQTQSFMVLVLRRKYGAYIFNTFLPCIILELIGLLTHAIPLDDLSDRLMVTLSCLIVMAALFTQVSSTLPASAEPKLIDIWMCSHVGILFLIFLVHIFMSLAHENIDDSKDEPQPISKDAAILENKKWAVMKSMLELDQIMIQDPSAGKKKKKSRCASIFGNPVIVNRIGFVLCIITYLGFCLGFVFVLLFSPI